MLVIRSDIPGVGQASVEPEEEENKSAAHTVVVAAVEGVAHTVAAHMAAVHTVVEAEHKLVVGELEHIATVGVVGERTWGNLLLAFEESRLRWWSLSGTCTRSLRSKQELQ